jgi:phosphatidate cytidylyltransferase
MPQVASGLLWTLALVFTALAVGSTIRVVALCRMSRDARGTHFESLKVWWILFFAFGLALIFGKVGLSLLFCGAGILAVCEFHLIYARRSFDSPGLAITVAGMGIVHYGWLIASDAVTWGLPLVVLILLSSIEIFLGRTQDYLRATAGYFWAFVLMIFGVSHCVALVALPAAEGPLSVGAVGWCIFLVLLTESNDIAQALVGRKYGKHKIVPAVSPGKSWEGLAGGFICTVVLAMLLAPLLTGLTAGSSQTLNLLHSAVAGGLISLCGFLGDINMSAFKREAGVKDSSRLLPGMGGMIDRIDSLTLAAPAFYYYASAVVQR